MITRKTKDCNFRERLEHRSGAHIRSDEITSTFLNISSYKFYNFDRNHQANNLHSLFLNISTLDHF